MNERVVIDPNICNGRPTVRAARITAQTAVEFLAAGDSVENVPTCTKFKTRSFANGPVRPSLTA